MLKKLWFKTHWLLGISAGLVLALMGASGALLSFENEILRALNPRLMTVPVQSTPALAPPELLARIAQQNPGRSIGTISVNAEPGRAARVGFIVAPKDGEKAAASARPRQEVYFVSPYSGELLGAEDELLGHDFLHLAEDLHRRLVAGDVGKALTGASTLILLLLAGTGLYLRWPSRWWNWRVWLTVRTQYRGAPFLRSLHEVLGTWLLLPYLLAALTGLFWSYDWYRNGVFALTGATPPARQALRAPDATAAVPDLHAAWDGFVRSTADTGYSSASFNLPAPGQPLTINYLAALPEHERASNRITLDLASGEPGSHERYADKTTGQQLAASMFVLHKGSLAGLPGTLAMMLASLAMPLFAVTGWMLYLKRRRAPQGVAASPKAAGTTTA